VVAQPTIDLKAALETNFSIAVEIYYEKNLTFFKIQGLSFLKLLEIIKPILSRYNHLQATLANSRFL
jgi:PhoPQ-activated pathogenicity-related protein